MFLNNIEKEDEMNQMKLLLQGRNQIILAPALVAFVCWLSASLSVETYAAEVELASEPGYIRRGLRENAKSELKESRGEVEDELRAKALGSFWRPEQIEKVRTYLNRPWDKEALEYLWSVVEHSSHGEDSLRIGIDPGTLIPNVLNLLAYVHTNYEDKELRGLICGKFDSMSVEVRENPKKYFRYMAHFLGNSVADYGTTDLLGPGFWSGMKPSEGSLYGLKLLENIGDEEVVKKLKEMKKSASDDKTKEALDKTIKKITNRLNGIPEDPLEAKIRALIGEEIEKERQKKNGK